MMRGETLSKMGNKYDKSDIDEKKIEDFEQFKLGKEISRIMSENDDSLNEDADNIEDDVDKRVFQIKNGTIYKLRLTSWEKLDDFRRSDLNKCRSDSNWYITGNDENDFLPLNAPKVIKITLR